MKEERFFEILRERHHTYAKMIHKYFCEIQSKSEDKRLQNYKIIKPFPTGIYFPLFNFYIEVKENAPLRSIHEVTKISISVPPDLNFENTSNSKINEILFFDKHGQPHYKHPHVCDVKRFDDVDKAIEFLDNIIFA